MKSAELLAESNLRTSCIANISDCFQKACKDTMDPNDPDGSYDMCLSRPETVKSLCKVQIDPCIAAEPLILDFVYARLAAIRVDACTNEVKHCLQADDRCGPDYANCIGLDLSDIKAMCPLDKLVACQKDGELNSMNDLDSLIQGIYLGIDNSLLTECQLAVENKMIELCGETTSCPAFDNDTYIGTGSLVTQQNGNEYTITGMISFSNIKIARSKKNNKDYNIDVDSYMSDIKDADENVRERIRSTLDGIAQEVNRRIDIIRTDPKIEMCINGRDMSQIRGTTRGATTDEFGDPISQRSAGRFPNLLNSYINVMANAALIAAKDNYDKEFAREYANANTATEEYRNTLYCNAMGQRDTFSDDLLTSAKDNNNNSGIKDSNLWSLTFGGGSANSTLEALVANSEASRVVLDPTGTMVAKYTVNSLYERGPMVCRITTTTYPCSGFEAIYNGKSQSTSVGASVGVGAVSVGANVGHSQSSTTYKGNFCNSYAEPIIMEQIINMAGGSDTVHDVTITRSNLQSYYNDSSSISNITDNSKSVDLGGISTGDISNIGSGNTNIGSKNRTKVDNSKKNSDNNNSNNKNSNNKNSGNKGKNNIK